VSHIWGLAADDEKAIEHKSQSRSIVLRNYDRLECIAEMHETDISKIVNSLVELGLNSFFDSKTNTYTNEMRLLRSTAQKTNDFELHDLIKVALQIVAGVLSDEALRSRIESEAESTQQSPKEIILMYLKKMIDSTAIAHFQRRHK